eukprot:05849.XXX_198148_198330_1 [CDS] Oithona nana genome sequencing.
MIYRYCFPISSVLSSIYYALARQISSSATAKKHISNEKSKLCKDKFKDAIEVDHSRQIKS